MTCSCLEQPRGGEELVGLGVGVLGRMRRQDPYCPPPEGNAHMYPQTPGRSQKGRGCTMASLPLGFADADSGASGVRAAPAGGGGRQAWTELQDSPGAWLSLFQAQKGACPISHRGGSPVEAETSKGPPPTSGVADPGGGYPTAPRVRQARDSGSDLKIISSPRIEGRVLQGNLH